jgi:hypothetical protein
VTIAADIAGLKKPAAAFDPATLALTGWYRGTWAVPWPGTASTGTSGTKTLQSNGHDPVAGTTLNGHQAADFAGSHMLVDSVNLMPTYISTSAYRIHMLIYVTATGAPGGIFSDPGLITENGGSWGVTINNTGIQVYHAASQVAASAGALATGAWHDVDILFDGAHVTITVDGVAGTPGATTSAGFITGATMFVAQSAYVTAHPNVQIMDLLIANTALAGTTAAALKGYVNARYGLSL